MLDPQLLRNEPQAVRDACAKRGHDFDVKAYEQLEAKRKELQQKAQDLQQKTNKGAAQIGQQVAKGEDPAKLKAELKQVNEELKPVKQELDKVLEQLKDINLNLPNIIDEDVPVGKDESDNRTELEWGDKPKLDFKPKEHFELCPNLLDFTLASTMAGSRFSLLRGKLAQLHRALASMMLDLHTREHGYEEINVPVLLNSGALTNSGQLPKFEEDLFRIGEDGYYLNPTSEVGLVNIANDRIFKADELPLKLTAHSLCFRREAGSYGKDVKGMLRQHQFEKVELVQVTKPQDSEKALEEMCQQAQKVLQLLKLPYRVVTLCSGDIGFGAAKTYDIEVWLPGQDTYREISSCSNCRDFQARRMQARWVPDASSKQKELVHTLNASGVAVGRTLIAVLENYQTKDGTLAVPEVLRKYLPEGFPVQIELAA